MKEIPKIYDIIFLYNEHNLLKKRIEYLSDAVEGFLILNFGPIVPQLSNPKIKVIQVQENFFNFFTYDNVDLLKKELLTYGVKFTDIVLFSKVNEIPNREDLCTFSTHLKSGPIILKQKNYFWNQNYKSATIHMGSCVMLLTHLAQDYKILHKLWEVEFPYFIGNTTLYSGWNLNGFFDDKDTFTESFQYWNQLRTSFSHIKAKLSQSKRMLKEFWIKKNPKKVFFVEKTELPKIFHSKTKIEISRYEKILIKLENTITSYSQYDEIFEIGLGVINHVNNKTYKVIIPKNPWYQQDLDFQIDYTKNEILRVLNELHYNDFDEIYIIKKTDENPSVYKLEEFKKLIPSECF